MSGPGSDSVPGPPSGLPGQRVGPGQVSPTGRKDLTSPTSGPRGARPGSRAAPPRMASRATTPSTMTSSTGGTSACSRSASDAV